MTKERWIIVGVTAGVAVAAIMYRASQPVQRVRLELIQQLDVADKRPLIPSPGTWCVPVEATLAGERKLAIAVLPNSRLAWQVIVPPRALLRAWIGTDEKVWDQEGDGILFRIGVSDSTGFRDLVVRQVNPFLVSGDRRWVPVAIDLTPYSGLEVRLMFNTNSSPPGRGDDTRNDLPLWGDPAIVTTR
jgi:hypothetical protein